MTTGSPLPYPLEDDPAVIALRARIKEITHDVEIIRKISGHPVDADRRDRIHGLAESILKKLEA